MRKRRARPPRALRSPLDDQVYREMNARHVLLVLLSLQVANHQGLSRADEVPDYSPKPPEICNLSVSRQAGSGNVLVTWSGGTPPFLIIRADAECFGRSSELTYLSSTITTHRFVDVRASKSGKRFWYNVFDANSDTELYSIGPSEPDDGKMPRTIHPNGDGDCGDSDRCRNAVRSPKTWR